MTAWYPMAINPVCAIFIPFQRRLGLLMATAQLSMLNKPQTDHVVRWSEINTPVPELKVSASIGCPNGGSNLFRAGVSYSSLKTGPRCDTLIVYVSTLGCVGRGPLRISLAITPESVLADIEL